jgi:hypothetical protein
MSDMSEKGLLSQYKDLAVEWDSAQGNAKQANQIFEEMHHIALRLRSTEAGRDGLLSLLDHPNRGVRLVVAGECLAWEPEAATAVLEGLANPRGTHSLSAQMTIREFQAGRLRFDW